MMTNDDKGGWGGPANDDCHHDDARGGFYPAEGQLVENYGG